MSKNMQKAHWGINDIPKQDGRIVVITGATSGIGKEAARVFAYKNAKVILAVRNIVKGQEVADSIRNQFTTADITVRELDLASLESVKVFADAMILDYPHLDVLINNAGIMMCPYAKTQDGFEIQFGTNHLGHFALTLRLLPLLKKRQGSRVVVVSSLAHKSGKLDFSDLQWTTRKYQTGRVYCDTKLANLYFAYELARKLETEGGNPKVTAAHPGWTATELQRHWVVLELLNHIFAQSIAMGALPTLRAAIDEDTFPGDYFGPAKFSEMRGYPIKVESTANSHDIEAAHNLWKLSEEMTGIKYTN
jgi:NAD(P)-dependent dehydrogenase (short-subunit alcohol dehydrogenase family)